MPNTYVNKVVKSNGDTIIDLTDATASADKILQGYTAYGADGSKLVGTATGGGSDEFVITLSYNSSSEMWEPDCTFAQAYAAHQAGKSVIFTADGHNAVFGFYSDDEECFIYTVYEDFWDNPTVNDYGTTAKWYFFDSEGATDDGEEDYRSTLAANAVPSDVASGKAFYNANGFQVGTATPSSTTLQSKTKSYTPTETAQSETVTADSGYDGLSSVAVSVGAISPTYVGSGITQRSSTDLSASGATVTAPAGYYASQATKSVASGTAGTPTATKGTVSNHSVSVTPSVTNTTGYITGSTKTGTAVTVSASELVSGTKTITENGTGIDVTNFASVDVNIQDGNNLEYGIIDGTSSLIGVGTIGNMTIE